jgi:cell wall-associated NlpC family hydrolase
MAKLRPLDLIFFGSGARIDHVGIHMGNLAILHASGHVRLESLQPGAPGFREDLRERFAWATRPVR